MKEGIDISEAQLKYMSKTVKERIESDLRSFKFQKILDKFLEKEELSLGNQELKSRYEDYRSQLFEESLRKRIDQLSCYDKMITLTYEEFINKMILIKDKTNCNLSKKDRDTLKIIYFLLKKI